MDYAHVYDVLAQARAKLLAWVQPLTPSQYTQVFPFGLRTLRATLVEIAVTEWFLTRWIRGDPLPPRPEWPISEERQPDFPALAAAWQAMAPQTRAVLAAMTDGTLTRELRFTRPGHPTIVRAATCAQIATQMLMHEVHHRAQAMAMLRQLGVDAENLDYIRFVQQRREEPA